MPREGVASDFLRLEFFVGPRESVFPQEEQSGQMRFHDGAAQRHQSPQEEPTRLSPLQRQPTVLRGGAKEFLGDLEDLLPSEIQDRIDK